MPRARLNPRLAPRLDTLQSATIQREAMIEIERAADTFQQSIDGLDIDAINTTLVEYETRISNLETPP